MRRAPQDVQAFICARLRTSPLGPCSSICTIAPIARKPRAAPQHHRPICSCREASLPTALPFASLFKQEANQRIPPHLRSARIARFPGVLKSQKRSYAHLRLEAAKLSTRRPTVSVRHFTAPRLPQAGVAPAHPTLSASHLCTYYAFFWRLNHSRLSCPRLRLESQQKAIDVARREYETARAEFYEVPTEESRKTAMLGIEVGAGVDG